MAHSSKGRIMNCCSQAMPHPGAQPCYVRCLSSADQGHKQEYVGDSVSGPTPDILHQNLHLREIPHQGKCTWV